MASYTTSATPAGKRGWSKHDLWQGTREKIEARQASCCAYCEKHAPAGGRKGGHIDHVVPRVAGGSNRADNLVWACSACNLAKADKSVEQHLARKPEQLAKVRQILATPLASAARKRIAQAKGVR